MNPEPNDWYKKNWLEKELQRPQFVAWFEKEYGKPESFSDAPGEADEYWTRRAFALMGWIARPKLELDDYQAANLLWCLKEIMSQPLGGKRNISDLDTGDWVGEIRCKLEELKPTHTPNGYS